MMGSPSKQGNVFIDLLTNLKATIPEWRKQRQTRKTRKVEGLLRETQKARLDWSESGSVFNQERAQNSTGSLLDKDILNPFIPMQ